MPRDKDKRLQRNLAIVEEYLRLRKVHPKWRYDAIVADIAEKFFLTDATIRKILNSTPFPEN